MKRMNKLTNNHGRGSGLILIVAAIIAVLVATQLGGLGAGGETKKQQEQIQQDAVNTAQEDYAAALLDAFGPDRADVIYECAGTDITMDQAIQNARKGSTIILVAVFGKRANVDLAKLNDSELDLNTGDTLKIEAR